MNEKNFQLAPYVKQLVDKKISSKNNRLEKDAYTNTLQTLKKFGCNWVTVSNLKMRVMREYNKQKKT